MPSLVTSVTSPPVQYPFPYQTVYTALQSALGNTRIRPTYADPANGYLRADRPMTLFSLGENIQIWLQAPQADLTLVTVHSSMKFGFVDWGVNQRNLRDIFNALTLALNAGQAPAGPAP